MLEEKPPEPLDLASFDDVASVPSTALVPSPQSAPLTVTPDNRLDAEAPPPRLVEVATLSPEDLAAAQQSAATPEMGVMILRQTRML